MPKIFIVPHYILAGPGFLAAGFTISLKINSTGLNSKRWLYIILIAINIPLGLATRYAADYFPYLARKYGGDTFAASCIFFGIRFLFNRPKLWKIAVINYAVCVSIETLQLYHAPWIESIRHTPPFGILLGYGFLWSDWLCYAAGTIIAFMIAYFFEKLLNFQHAK